MKTALLIFSLALASAQSPGLTAGQCQCSIEVTVKRASGEPLGEAAVNLSLGVAGLPSINRSTPGSQSILTDSAGHVVFQNLAEGRYTVSVQHEGYFSPPRNGSSTNVPSVIVDVGPASRGSSGAMADTGRLIPGGVLFTDRIQPVQELEFTMNPGGVISGRLTDANQQPQSGVTVGALRVTYAHDRRVLIPIGNTVTTNDRGEYRLFWLSPGEYYVQAKGAAGTRQPSSTMPAMNYFPGTLDPSAAVPVSVQVGQEQSQINFSPIWPSGVTISGTVTNNVPGGVTRANGQVNRSLTEIAVQQSSLFSPVLLDPNRVMHPAPDNPNVSTFEIRNVPPGAYDVYFVFRQGPSVSDNAIGRTTINVGTTDIAGLGDASGNVRRPTTGGCRISEIDTNGMRLKSISQEQLPSYSC